MKARILAAAIPWLSLALIALGFSGCRSNPGEACTDTPGSCSDKASHLVCVGGKYVLETCKGPGGCNDDKALTCDSAKADVGDGCGHEGARSCATDGSKELRCRGGQFAIEWSCRGGCTTDANNNPKCVPTGNAGEICRPDSIVCDTAAKNELDCVDGKLVQTRTCNGALGCVTPPGGGVRCDRTQALENEECRSEGNGACDMAKKNVLVCTNGHFKTQLKCDGPIGCELPGNYSVRCDKSIVNENEPCTEDASLSCTPDGKQVRCTDGKFVVDKKWKAKKDEPCNNRYRISFETEKFEAR